MLCVVTWQVYGRAFFILEVMMLVQVRFWHMGQLLEGGEAVEYTDCTMPVGAIPQIGESVRLLRFGTDEYPITQKTYVMGQDGQLERINIDLRR